MTAHDAPNRGAVFAFEEFRQIVLHKYSVDCPTNFVDWIQKKFMAVTLLLGALRTEQFDRFRCGGLRNIKWEPENRNAGRLCPMATSSYNRVKPRNGGKPYDPDQNFKLTITCLCLGDHEPLAVTLDQKGYPKEPIAGNQDCWYGQFVYLTQHLVDKNDLDSKLLQLYNFRKKKFGTANVSKGVAKQALREFCNLVGVKKDKSINNISKVG